MQLTSIENEQQCEEAILRVYDLIQVDIKPASEEEKELEALSILIEKFEAENIKFGSR